MILPASTTYESAYALGAVADTLSIFQIFPTQASSLNQRLQAIAILRLEVILTSAIASRFHLLPAATAGTPIGPVVGGDQTNAENGGGGVIPLTNFAFAWGVQPTFAAGDAGYRVMSLPGVLAASQVWEWSDENPLAPPFLARRGGPPAGSFGPGICLRNITGGASGSVLINVRWKEYFPLSA